MNYTKEGLYRVFLNSILGKDKVQVANFLFYSKLGYVDMVNNKSVVVSDELPLLQIKNHDTLSELLHEYVSEFFVSEKKFAFPEALSYEFSREDEKVKMALLSIFNNTTPYDFENVNSFVKRRIDYLKNPLIHEHKNFKLAGDFEGVAGARVLFKMAENNYSMETPERLDVMVERQNEKGETEFVYLPSISFGISGNTAHVYSIQKLKLTSIEFPEFEKKLNKARYKINKNIAEEDLDVEPFSLISASVFTGFLKAVGVENIQVNNYLPIRYETKRCAFERKSTTDEDIAVNSSTHERIQNCLTNKFLKTFVRLNDQTNATTLFSDIEPGFTVFKNRPDATYEGQTNSFLKALHDNSYSATLSTTLSK